MRVPVEERVYGEGSRMRVAGRIITTRIILSRIHDVSSLDSNYLRCFGIELLIISSQILSGRIYVLYHYI